MSVLSSSTLVVNVRRVAHMLLNDGVVAIVVRLTYQSWLTPTPCSGDHSRFMMNFIKRQLAMSVGVVRSLQVNRVIAVGVMTG